MISKVFVISATATIASPFSTPVSAQQPDAFVVDLSRATVRGSLPFDERFLLIGFAPRELQRVEPYRIERRGIGVAVCSATFTKNDIAGRTWERTHTAPVVSPSTSPATGSSLPTSVGSSQPFPVRPVTTDSFTVTMNELRPDRNYAFCLRYFSTLPDTALARLRAAAAKTVSGVLKQRVSRTPPGVATAAEIDSVVNELQKAIPKSGPGQTLVISDSSLFSSSLRARERALPEFVGLQGPALNVVANRRSMATAAHTVADHLAGLQSRRGRVLSQVVSSLSPGDTILLSGLANMNSAAASIRAVVAPSPDLFRLVSEGAAVLGDSLWPVPTTATPLDSVWAADDVSSRLAAVEQTSRRLERLRTLLTVVLTRPDWQARAGIDSGSVRTVVASVDSIRGDFAVLAQRAANLARAISDRDAAINKTVSAISLGEQNEALLFGTTVEVAVDTRSKRYISAALGVVYAPQLRTAAPLAGFTFFPWGVNKRVPQHLTDRIGSRIGVQIGLTTSSVAKKDEREDLFGHSALAAGLTWRFLDVFHLSGGGLVLRQFDRAALTEDSHIRITPYSALSFDLDVQAIIGGIGKLLGGG